MPFFRKKPVVIEAMQLTIDNLLEVARFAGPSWSFKKVGGSKGLLFCIRTLEGEMIVNVGDWIIKGISGEFYPCKPDIFEKSYDRVNQGELES